MTLRTLLVLLALAAGCRDDGPCAQGLVVTLEKASGALAPGLYHLDIILDGQAYAVECEAGDDGLVDYCQRTQEPETPRFVVRGLFAVDAGFDDLLFAVDDPDALCVTKKSMPQAISVTLHHADTVLASESWEPHYTGCRNEFCVTYGSAHRIVLD